MARRKKTSKKYYYTFVAIVLIVVLTVALLDYKFRFGIVNWDAIFPNTESGQESQSNIEVNVDEIGNLKITFIDVGQGDAILVSFPDGKHMLIDAGENKNSVKSQLDEYLTVGGEKIKLDYVVATHTDSDHIGSMDYVYQNYDIGYSYRPFVEYDGKVVLPDGFINDADETKSSDTYGNYLLSIANECTPYSYFTDLSDFTVSVNAGGANMQYSVDFAMPYAKTTEGFKDFSDSNDFSAVIIIEFAGRKIMLTGDMEKEAEEKFVEYYTQNPSEKAALDCDVLKVAHHGSETSTTMDFLNLIKPEYSVISTGLCHRGHRHPREKTLNSLIYINSKIYRTDLQGTVTLVVTPSGEMNFTVQTEEFNEYLLLSADQIMKINGLEEEIENFKESL